MIDVIRLIYIINDNQIYNDIYFMNDMINASNLTSYFNFKSLESEFNQAVIYNYDETIQSIKNCNLYENIAQIYNSMNNSFYFCC